MKNIRNSKAKPFLRLLRRLEGPPEVYNKFLALIETDEQISLPETVNENVDHHFLMACCEYNYTKPFEADGLKRSVRASFISEERPEHCADIALRDISNRAEAIEQAYRRGYVSGFAHVRQLLEQWNFQLPENLRAKIKLKEDSLQAWRVRRIQILGSHPGSKEEIAWEKISIRESISPSLRYRILERDKFRCQFCGQSPKIDGIALHIDHRVSIAEGGSNSEDNLWTLCEQCNFGKGKKSFAESSDL